ncbi:metalloregulator ArsR/SmtB family transcription factor [Thalassococcus sp. CAU 1522]|uniref:Metalloregulator ArsR/SmtB family transcription factor n=1 Tax=Thalassococcus arenae TaxID=2851652 RepID=A0ABS6NCA4_9RHOB|nr:metalloregulator ArsR/SmtB family transcription factor [Thalassococcus arenae]MBV2361657.1 metalloregulator ArsR/SmtB family transcription factor [Thalassococcus arenae]
MESELRLDQLSALAHPHRLAVFRLLMRRYPDAVSAGDLAGVLGVPKSTLSPALNILRQTGLVSQRREGTFLLYRADTDGAARLVEYLVSDCCRGRPDLCNPVTQTGQETAMTHRPYHVLFLCTGNSARSIFAEALLRSEAGDKFVAHSAGIDPQSEPNPIALQMLRDKGHDVAGLHSKHADLFRQPDAPRMDFVFTVCDRAANEDCPAWPGQPISGHWGQPDPVKAQGTEAQKTLAFQQVYGALRNRIRAFAALPFDTLDRATLQARVDEIAEMKDD